MRFWLIGLAWGLVACGQELPMTAPEPAPDLAANALFDRRITSLVSDIFVAYDHNKNGVLELRRPQGGNWLTRLGNWFVWQDETTRTARTTFRSNDEITYVTRIYTRFPLFLAADADKDQLLSVDELTAFIEERYDDNHDGELTARGLRFWRDKNELELFNADFGERLMSQRDLDLPRPTPRSSPLL